MILGGVTIGDNVIIGANSVEETVVLQIHFYKGNFNKTGR